jgi:phosphoglycolate phosphatase
MRRFDAVIWDLDGTLVETSRDIATAVNLLLAERDLPPMSVAAISAHIGQGARVQVTGCLRESGVMELNAPEVERAYESFRDHYRAHLLDTTVPYPGVPELLKRLHTAGVAMGVVTCKPEELSRRLIDGLGLSSFFRAVFGGDTLPEQKPDPAPLLRMKKRLAANNGRCVMAGDMIYDIEAARAAGIPCVAVAWGFTSRERLISARPDMLAENPALLGEWILG